MEAKCIRVIHEPGGSYKFMKVSYNPRVSKPAQLLLECELDGHKIEVNIFSFFRGHFPKFTKERIKAIRQTMPKTVIVEKNPSFLKKDYESQYRVSQEDLVSWLKRVEYGP